MTPAQDKAWRRLIAAARRASRAANVDEREHAAAEIRAALKATWKARGGDDALTRPLIALLGLAKGYLAVDAAHRQANAAAMAVAAQAARLAMKSRDEASTHFTSSRRFRRDIDG